MAFYGTLAQSVYEAVLEAVKEDFFGSDDSDGIILFRHLADNLVGLSDPDANGWCYSAIDKTFYYERTNISAITLSEAGVSGDSKTIGAAISPPVGYNTFDDFIVSAIVTQTSNSGAVTRISQTSTALQGLARNTLKGQTSQDTGIMAIYASARLKV